MIAASARAFRMDALPKRRGEQPIGEQTAHEEPMTETLLPSNYTPTVARRHGSETLEGHVIGVVNDKVVGWAWDSAKPYQPVDVELFIGELRVGRGSANVFDIELAQAERGNGMHRFELSLERLPTSPPPFEIRILISDTDRELLPPVRLVTIAEAERLLTGTKYVGKVTGIVDGKLSGWVFSRENPHEEPVLTLRDGDTNVLTRRAKGQTSALIDTGVAASVFRFELPLPSNVVDGKPHLLSVLVGASGHELTGSPLMFGPADVSSIGMSLAAVSARQRQLESQVASLQPGLDQSILEKRIADSMFDRIDMLLNIHRDALERELAVLRRQVTELIGLSTKSEPDVIRPRLQTVAIEDEHANDARSFAVMARSGPQVSYDLKSKLESVVPSAGLKWSDSPIDAGVSIRGNGNIELDGVHSGPASLVVRGSGAIDPLEFCSIVMSFHACALTGRVDITESGDWTLIGSTVVSSASDKNSGGLSIAYLSGFPPPSGRLIMKHVSVFHRGRVPDRVDSALPRSTVLYIGNDTGRDGWYPTEIGPRGGLCWMSGQADAILRIQQTGAYQLTIPEARPLVPDLAQNLQVTLSGVPMKIKLAPAPGDTNMFQVSGEARVPPVESGALRLRLSFPENCVRSPMELGLNADQRPLTLAIRTVALSALEI
jgi:hypothetical protein